MSQRISRREFLRAASLVAGAATVAACAPTGCRAGVAATGVMLLPPSPVCEPIVPVIEPGDVDAIGESEPVCGADPVANDVPGISHEPVVPMCGVWPASGIGELIGSQAGDGPQVC